MPIFDQGYQHWTGRLSGHAWRWLTITRHGVRIGMKNRILRILLFLSWLPAVALILVLSQWGLQERNSQLVNPLLTFLTSMRLLDPAVLAAPLKYRVEFWTLSYSMFLSSEVYLSMVLIVLVGPDLISQDLRFNALPLYLSRPLRRIDYLVGKLGVIAVFLGMVIIVPSLLAYALGLLFSPDLTIVRDTYRVLLASMAYGLVIVVSAGSLILALSSLSRNSRYVALMWLGIWIISGIVGTILESADQTQRRQASYNRTMAARPMTPGPQGRGDQRRRAQAISEVRRSGREEFEAEELRASKTDWRPLVSYTANLSRVGRQLLGTDACWETFSRFQPPGQRERFRLEWSGPQYPWTWSAGVLAGLFGLSVWILSFPFRSLDRLR